MAFGPMRHRAGCLITLISPSRILAGGLEAVWRALLLLSGVCMSGISQDGEEDEEPDDEEDEEDWEEDGKEEGRKGGEGRESEGGGG